MFENLPQFVPQEKCLLCDSCCRFQDKKSFWRPVVIGSEKDLIEKRRMDEDARIKTVSGQKEYFCTFLNAPDNKCKIYSERPFECRLYPLLLSKKGNSVSICVHLSCPFVQEKHGSAEYESVVKKVEEYFSSEEIKSFIIKNINYINDYSAYKDEIEELFKIC